MKAEFIGIFFGNHFGLVCCLVCENGFEISGPFLCTEMAGNDNIRLLWTHKLIPLQASGPIYFLCKNQQALKSTMRKWSSFLSLCPIFSVWSLGAHRTPQWIIFLIFSKKKFNKLIIFHQKMIIFWP